MQICIHGILNAEQLSILNQTNHDMRSQRVEVHETSVHALGC